MSNTFFDDQIIKVIKLGWVAYYSHKTFFCKIGINKSE